MSTVANAASPLSPNQLADRLIISQASTTSLIDTLERRGYIHRRPHHADRRMLFVELTDRGRQVADAFRPIVHCQERVWLDILAEDEQQRLIDLLQRLQATLMNA